MFRYKEAVAACNAEEAVGAEASRAAHSHMAAFEEQNRAFKLHEDNHAQLWHEAKECALHPVLGLVAGLLIFVWLFACLLACLLACLGLSSRQTGLSRSM